MLDTSFFKDIFFAFWRPKCSCSISIILVGVPTISVGGMAMVEQKIPSSDSNLSSGQAHLYPLELISVFGANKHISLHFPCSQGFGI